MHLKTDVVAVRETAVRREVWVCAAGTVAFAVAMAVAAYVRIPLPFSPVPLTLQTFIVLLAGATLGPWAGASSQGLYLAAGACGAPVFAGGSAGLSGPTVGYLVAFPLAAWIVGRAAQHSSRWALPFGMVLGTLAIYSLGTLWLSLCMGKSLAAGALLGIVPFLPGDGLKLAAAISLAGLARRGYEKAARL